MSDVLEALRNIGQDELDVTRDILETLCLFTEKYEPYAKEYIHALHETLDQMPATQEDINTCIELGVAAEMKQESE